VRSAFAVCAVLAVGAAGLFLLSGGSLPRGWHIFFGAFLVLSAAIAAVAARARPGRIRSIAMGAATGSVAVSGLLAAATIGILLLPLAVWLGRLTLRSTQRGRLDALGGAVASILVAVGGFVALYVR